MRSPSIWRRSTWLGLLLVLVHVPVAASSQVSGHVKNPAEFHESEAASTILADPDSDGLSGAMMRRGGSIELFRLWRLVLMIAALCSFWAAWTSSRFYFSHLKFGAPKVAKADARSSFPWPDLPHPQDIAAVGATYTASAGNAMQQALKSSGMKPARKGAVALLSFSYADAPASVRKPKQRALIERCCGMPAGRLALKRVLAAHLERWRLEDFAPPTFRRSSALRKLLMTEEQSALPAEVAEGFWFLKHSSADATGDGVVCFQGAEALLKFWRSMSQEIRSRYIAQADVCRPLLLNGCRMKVRAYVLMLSRGRYFIHRELLLCGLPAPDPDDAEDMLRQRRRQKKRATFARGTAWQHHGEVWPKLCDMLAACFCKDIKGSTKEQQKQSSSEEDERSWDHWLEELASCIWWGSGKAAGALCYNFFGVDFVVDQDLRPWLIEMNPTSKVHATDPLAVRLWADVMEDLCSFLTEPLLRAGQLAPAKVAKHVKAAKSASTRKPACKKAADQKAADQNRGFVEIRERTASQP